MPFRGFGKFLLNHEFAISITVVNPDASWLCLFGLTGPDVPGHISGRTTGLLGNVCVRVFIWKISYFPISAVPSLNKSSQNNEGQRQCTDLAMGSHGLWDSSSQGQKKTRAMVIRYVSTQHH